MESDNTLDVPLPPAPVSTPAPGQPISGFTLMVKALCSAIMRLFMRNPQQP
jgi:hypothetical protein